MKIQPEIFKVHIEDRTIYSGDNKEDTFLKAQSKFKGLEFLTLTAFDADKEYGINLIEESDLVLSKDQIFEMSLRAIQFKIIQTINVDIDITKQLIELAEKPIKLIQDVGGGNTYNNKCEVHMPGYSLSLYNEMLLKESCCTDDLQSELNSGWRIIAACPQPDQRRPDYILGRFNPDLSIGGRAAR